MNNFFHLYQHFAKYYIDDIIIFFKIIKKYLNIFELFFEFLFNLKSRLNQRNFILSIRL